MHYRLFAAFVLALLLNGCANITHFLTISPLMDYPTAELTNSHKIVVTTTSTVSDNIGAIDTALNKHADLVLANDLSERVNTKVIEGLKSLGFKPDEGSTPAATVEITITKLTYTTTTDALKTMATLNFAMRAKVTGKNKVYNGNYATELKDEYAALPKRAELEETISDITGQAIKRLLDDPNVRILLQ